ncbi:MAG: SUF system Fe-S cluster assembly protein [Gammaproteobacteria bacterium]|jgi:FeS assembly SUF system protein|nr:SUF system Fe-S cluster assembly protein [Gammaproteobacteria bacterium]
MSNRPEHLSDVDFNAIQGLQPEVLDRLVGVGATEDAAVEDLRRQVIEALKTVYDPELPVNIYDLGLIYRLDVDAQGDILIVMTLTAPGCPVAGIMPVMVRNAVTGIDGIGCVDVSLVWEPQWSPERMSEAARLELNIL